MPFDASAATFEPLLLQQRPAAYYQSAHDLTATRLPFSASATSVEAQCIALVGYATEGSGSGQNVRFINVPAGNVAAIALLERWNAEFPTEEHSDFARDLAEMTSSRVSLHRQG